MVSGDDDVSRRPLKVYFIAHPSPGHIAPLTKIAHLFAARGEHVTILTTPANVHFQEKSIDKGKTSGYHANIHAVKFPSKEVGLLTESKTSLTPPIMKQQLKFGPDSPCSKLKWSNIWSFTHPIASLPTCSPPGPPTSLSNWESQESFSTSTVFSHAVWKEPSDHRTRHT
ncbi:Glycosyltransferase [Quillaja saponaria]|uniref:Glycosyltransferase n=1 Tax=Quillaja saponaria TaxID=32244 RepID=A0AAD7L5V6_QUISA|nr:Glycosyltransferase [Quillaja saponaria]